VRRAWLIVCLGALSSTAALDRASLAQSPSPGSATAQRQPAASLTGTMPRALADAERALVGGDPARALELASAFARQHPAAADAHVIIARVHLERNEPAAAYDALRRALAANPRHVDALYYMGGVAARLAEAEMDRLTTVAPDSARVRQLMAEALEVQDRRTEAAAEYEAALQRQPDLLDALLALARLKRTSLECGDAIALYRRAEAVRPTYDGAYGLGACLQYEQQDDAAIEQFQKALTLDPRAALAWKDLGVSLLKVGRTDEAIRHMQKAISLEPRMHEAHYALGQAYRAAGDRVRSQEAFAAAERLQSDPQPPR
jgi:tetratricopeptide (TPR) repeat protein